MPKQVKIGFDKIPSPPIKVYPALVDIQGTPLTDSAGNPLVTEDDATLATFAKANNSMSVFATNKLKVEAIPVEERFATESEVSNTLLGVKRAEEQLSLFADVSTYGLDRNNWNYYTIGEGKYPSEWYDRKHPVYGRRTDARFYEGTGEQALYLRSFPVQYTYPTGPTWSGGTQSQNFKKYLTFIALGRYLYEVWKDVNLEFAKRNFLPPVLDIVDADRNPIEVITLQSSQNLGIVDPDQTTWIRGTGGFYQSSSFYDVNYTSDSNDSVQVAMDYIESWTLFYGKMRQNTASYPLWIGTGNQAYAFLNSTPVTGAYRAIQKYVGNDYSRPGDSGNNSTIGVLESRKTFRYQPGRVSGFTFGVRLKNNPASRTDKIEWGAANPTDQYMFQVQGSQFNIVRRSTVEPPQEWVEDFLGLTPWYNYVSNEVVENINIAKKIAPPALDNSVEMYEMVIPRTKWNGDPLDGTGASGYIIDFQNVTMYKIEYSWYGAVGAKFYAYVPIGSGEARWVMLHHLVIENQFTKPILQNPDFKFRYVLYNNNTEDLSEPTYIYKYGSSYYIDGGDEGTISVNSVTSDTRTFSSQGSVVGIHPKTTLINSTGLNEFDVPYGGNNNLKKIYPTTLSVFAAPQTPTPNNTGIRIDVTTVKVSPDGHHGSKSVGVTSGYEFEKPIAFRILQNQVMVRADGQDFSIFDKDSKVIADGLYNIYARPFEGDLGTAEFVRRSGYALYPNTIGDEVRLVDGTYRKINQSTESDIFEAQLVGYKSVVASNVPINSNKFKIHFLLPSNYDGRYSNYHFADFAIGVTPKQPSNVINEQQPDNSIISYLKFGDNERVFTTSDPITEGAEAQTYWDMSKELYVEYSNREISRDIRRGAENREVDFSNGTRFEIDYRIRGAELPFNGSKGVLACIQGEVAIESYPIFSCIKLDSVGPLGETHKIVFASREGIPPVTDDTVGIAEVGYNRAGTGFVYKYKDPESEFIEGQNRWVMYVGPAEGIEYDPDTNTEQQLENIILAGTSVQAKIVKLYDDNKLPDTNKDFYVQGVYRFNVQPLYLFIAMRSNVTINNIIVEEITATSKTTHVPNFQGLELDLGAFSNVSLLADSGVTPELAPTNFLNFDRLSGANYDTQTGNPIADGSKIYSFFVAGGESKTFDLSNIFNIDRYYISTGLYNNNAVYFNAVPLDPNAPMNVQMTVSTKEQ